MKGAEYRLIPISLEVRRGIPQLAKVYHDTLLICCQYIVPYCTNYKWELVGVECDYEEVYDISEKGELQGTGKEKLTRVKYVIDTFQDILIREQGVGVAWLGAGFHMYVWEKGGHHRSLHVQGIMYLGITEQEFQSLWRTLESMQLAQFIRLIGIPPRDTT